MFKTKNILFLFLMPFVFLISNACKQAKNHKANDVETVKERPISDDSNDSNYEDENEDEVSSSKSTPPDSSTSYPNIYEPEPAEDPLKKYENLLVFHVEDSMEVGQHYVASLDLAKNEAIEAIRTKIYQEKGDTTGVMKIDTTLTITPRMKAILLPNKTDKEKLAVTFLSSSEEQDLSTGKATWRWRLEPKQEGKINLTLVVEVVSTDSKVTALPPRFYDIKIYSDNGGFFSSVGRFLGDNWQWMISAVLLPFLIAWYTVRQTNKQRQQRKKEEEKRRIEDNRY